MLFTDRGMRIEVKRGEDWIPATVLWSTGSQINVTHEDGTAGKYKPHEIRKARKQDADDS